MVVASRGYSASPSSGLVEESNAITFSVLDAVHVGSPAAETVGPMAGFSGIVVLASEIVATLALVGGAVACWRYRVRRREEPQAGTDQRTAPGPSRLGRSRGR